MKISLANLAACGHRQAPTTQNWVTLWVADLPGQSSADRQAMPPASSAGSIDMFRGREIREHERSHSA